MKIKDKIVMGFWHNMDEKNRFIPNIPLMSIKSFIGNCKEYQLYSYQKFDNVPDGCKLMDAREIMSEDQFFIHKSGSLAIFSDYFRIHLLLKLVMQLTQPTTTDGRRHSIKCAMSCDRFHQVHNQFAENHDAIWFDTDNIFVKDGFDRDIVVIQQDGRIQSSFLYFGESETGDKIRTCARQFVDDPIKFRIYDSPTMKRFKLDGLLYQMRTSGKYNVRPQLDWQTSGSELYTCIFKHLGIMDIGYEYYKYFNPYKYTVQRELYVDDIGKIDMEKFKDVNVLVLSTDLLRREPDIRKNFNHNSFIASLCEKYGIEGEI